MDENQVLNAFEGALGQAEAPEATDSRESQTEARVEGADAPQAEVTEQPEVKAEEQEQTETIEIDPEAPLFEQEVEEEDGKKSVQKLSLKELQRSFLTDREIRKAKQDIARQKDELPKLVHKQVSDVRESYTKRLSELHAVVTKVAARELEGVDFVALAKEDPWRYAELRERREQLNELLQSVQKEREAEDAKRKEEEQKAKAERWQKSAEILQKDIPEFSPTVVRRLIESGEDWGFTKDEVAGWDDHRFIKMLHALSEKKAVETKRPQVEKRVAVVTKVVKPGQPAKPRADEAMTRLRKSGKREDAVDVFERWA